jgi:hypothetical protein
VVRFYIVQKLKQTLYLESSLNSEHKGYKVCMIWFWESAVLKHLKTRQGLKFDEQQFCKKGF